MIRELTLASAIHLFAVLPAVVIGAAQLLRAKGSQPHRLLGWAWVLAMAVGAASSFWIFAPANGGRFSVIHLLSVVVLTNLVLAIWFIRRGNARAHKGFMIGTYAGLILAGLGALTPGRLLQQLLF